MRRDRVWPHPEERCEAPRLEGRTLPMQLSRPPQLLCRLQIDRDQLRDAAFGHGDAEEAVHAAHGEPVMGDDEEARLSVLRDLLDEAAEAIDIGVVERRV